MLNLTSETTTPQTSDVDIQFTYSIAFSKPYDEYRVQPDSVNNRGLIYQLQITICSLVASNVADACQQRLQTFDAK